MKKEVKNLDPLLNPTEKAKFRDIVNKPNKTEDEQFLCELIHWISYPSQLKYLYSDGLEWTALKIAYSTSIARQSFSLNR